MGTVYNVSVFDEDDELDIAKLRLVVDAELRRVNDEMSTYLGSSEISQFNESETTDWFDVSPGFAKVVAKSLDVAEATNGAFDVTVGPLVNLWNFGPNKRSRKIPDDLELESAREVVGYQKLSVRLDPPAIKKDIADLRIDLSSIAKGHGSDRVVEALSKEGAENVFVEVGGEVRVRGSKDGVPWRVGVQTPDAAMNQITKAFDLTSEVGTAMATSGDYRNFFKVAGQKYSHTIDPRVGRPVRHDLASVSVVAEDCMTADAWATALSVVGFDEALALARQNDLVVYLLRRTDDGVVAAGTGALVSIEESISPSPNESSASGASSQWLATAMITLVAFGILLSAMAVGVIMGRRPIAGSCGGLNASKVNEDGTMTCNVCSNPVEGCRELIEKMEAAGVRPDPNRVLGKRPHAEAQADVVS
ncbi:MAG: FAD:protein FMN transferase [Planctomycetota bacterium]